MGTSPADAGTSVDDFEPVEARWQPSPYILLRLAGKPFDELSRLKFTQTVGLFEHILAARESLAQQKAALLELLFVEIGRHAGETRGKLVTLKRNIFNERMPPSKERRWLKTEDGVGLRSETVGYFWKLRQLKRLLKQGRTVFEGELAEKRGLFQQSCADAEFQKAIQVASPALFANVNEYVRAKPTALRARERQTEVGLFQYFMRMTSKTSPFSRFGPVALGRADLDAEHAFSMLQHAPMTRTTANLNLGAVTSVASSLAHVPGVQTRLYPRLNGTSYVDGNELVFARPRSVWDETVTFNQGIIRRVKYVPAVRGLIELLVRHEADSLTLGEFTSLYLSAVGATSDEQREKVEAFLNKLIGAGLIVNEFRLPSNTLDRLTLLRAEFARVAETAEAQAEAAKLEQLQVISREFQDAPAPRRQQILGETRQLLNDLVRWRPPIAAAQGELTNPYKEDTVVEGVRYVFGRPFFASVLEDISVFLDCIAARDQGGHSYAMLRDIFAHRYGEGGRCDNLLQLAAEYKGLLGKLLRRADESKHADPLTERFNKTQLNMGRYAYALGNHPVSKYNPRESLISHETMRSLTESFGESPLSPRPFSMAMHVQLAAADERAIEQGEHLVVLNYSLPGFGHFFSRYCHLFPPDSEHAGSLFEQISERGRWLQSQSGGEAELVEILSILDNNAQVHPPFTPRQIVPPDEVSDLPDERQIRMRDLQLAHDVESDELRLTAPLAGSPDGEQRQLLTPIYMGFFHLISLPMLQRLLVELSPTAYHMEALQPYDLRQGGRPFSVEGDEPEQTIRRYPRLRIGRFVLQREIWEVPSAALPTREADDEFTLFLNVYAWSRRYSLPPEVFVRIRRTQIQASELHTGHKPFMIDFENYFSLKMLFHLLSAGSVDTLEVEEMLPNPRQLFCTLKGQSYAAEFQIEFNRGD
ncbi:MAG: hypothetical protein QOH51_1238 [Acidobacteriota bacterium]|jgi:hypothetical protein|nr:hypothetical protein [Acidobacteriota bacterium]